ncbi:MAG: TIGR03619 family F420-dependent LLM class oxidoreductase [Acidimicrobiia bacterium]
MSVGICTYDISAGDLVELARLADECGFDALWVGEHTVLPAHHASRHPAQPGATAVHHGKAIVDPEVELVDPLVAVAAAAVATTRIRLATGIALLPLNHPLLVARAVATLHDISGGRFVYGAGSGWLAEEFEALGVDFATRGRRFDESIEILRRAWRGTPFSFHGEHFEFSDLRITTRPIEVPLVLGGNTGRALDRCARVGDGWLSSGNPTFEEAVHLSSRLHGLLQQHGRDPGAFRMFVRIKGITSHQVERYAEAGIEDVVVWAHEIFEGVAPDERADAMRGAADALGIERRSPSPVPHNGDRHMEVWGHPKVP